MVFIYVRLFFFSGITAIFAKTGMKDLDSNLKTAIRTIVVLIISCLIVFNQKKHKDIKNIDKRNWIYLILSGLSNGPVRGAVPVDKLSIVVAILFSYFIL